MVEAILSVPTTPRNFPCHPQGARNQFLFLYPCTISNIRTYLDSYERLFTLRGLFPSPVEEIC